MLKVTTPASNKRLTTVAAVRAMFGMTTDQMNDSGVEALIDRASDAAAAFCGRPFATETVRQIEFPQHLLHSIALERFPVSSVGLTVTEGGASLTIDADFVLDEEVSALRRLVNGYRWDWRCVSIQIDYTAGYVLPEDDGERTLPHDVEQAALYIVSDFWKMIKNAASDGNGIRALTLDGVGSVQYDTPRLTSTADGTEPGGLNPVAKILLAPYKRVSM